jgi:hypothetical protein
MAMWKCIADIVKTFAQDGKHNHALFVVCLLCATIIALAVVGATATKAMGLGGISYGALRIFKKAG